MLINNAGVGESYLLAGENQTYRDFFERAAKLAEKKIILIPIPSNLLNWLGEKVTFLETRLGWINSLSRANARMLCLPNYFSNQKARRDLAMSDNDTDLAIERSIEWFKIEQYF